MGIKRLSQFLKTDFVQKQIAQIANCTVGVDISSWVYQAYFCQLEFSGDNSLLVIRNIELKLKLLMKYNIKAIFVFDGHDLSCKNLTSEKRNKKRDYYHMKAKLNPEMEDEDIEKLGMYKRLSEPIPDSLFYDVLDFLNYRKQTVLVAPYESDSQLAHLYFTKKVEYIVSEDSDMFVYGCLKIIKGLKFNGDCKIMNLEVAPSKNAEIQTLMKLSHLIRQK